MEEARRLLERLDRIEALDRARAGPRELLAELRALLREAEAWSRAEDAGAKEVAELRLALAREMIEV
jgi:DNA-binding response OmpR family regulator